LIWTAGVTPVNTIKRSMFKTDKGKVIVNDYLEVLDFPGVFAIGDCALFLDPKTERPFPPTAQIAEAQAKTAAKNLKALIKNSQKEKFVYHSKGQMAIIGKRSGIATFLGMNISGFWAWLIWRNVYLSKIPTFEKKFRVFLDWTIDLFFDRDISRLKLMKRETEKEYKLLDEVDDVW
jgi:NADH dehydrogenase